MFFSSVEKIRSEVKDVKRERKKETRYFYIGWLNSALLSGTLRRN